MILTTFREMGEVFYPPLSLLQNQPLKSPPILELRNSILRIILQCQKFSSVENFEVSRFLAKLGNLNSRKIYSKIQVLKLFFNT